MKKLLIGMLAVFIGIGLASIGYKVGKARAQADSAVAPSSTPALPGG